MTVQEPDVLKVLMVLGVLRGPVLRVLESARS
jgi:hypothetical protein